MNDMLLITKPGRGPKQVFRSTGASLYNRNGWEILSEIEELPALLKVSNFSLISIGNLQTGGDNTSQIAAIIKTYYDIAKKKYPKIINNTGGEEFRDILKNMFKT